ncbi:hypothetical protein [Pedobacter sp. UBA4863]|uniref:hypothetical protein n=1 Tax=Pedobacter sp. UBA4863 TaxID=1947060 RepID=UPI0025F8F65F|nr:hypothetical protein [Pedobacter sp. UBA4863]
MLKEFASGQKDFFLKLGDSHLLKLSLEKSTDHKTCKLLTNSQEEMAETGEVNRYVSNIFYINLP